MTRNLVLAVVGDESLHKNWINASRNFQLYLIYYGNHKNKYKKDADFYLQRSGSKYFIIHDLIENNRDFFFKYDAIFMPDDDIYLETKDIIEMFNIFHNPDPKKIFDLAQPSIIGWYSLWITLHDPTYHYRFTNFVEIMCPIFSKKAIKELWETFTETKSSWGLDMVWDYKLGHPRNRIAIIDDVIAIHTRQVLSGDLYQNQIKHNPFDDLKYIGEKYGLPVHELTIYNGKKKNESNYVPHNLMPQKLLEK